ncbi:hypothetical protein [Pyxidicoccus sp. MSG2]|uniref:hypothetical protein n=1 Tax=Pyxidicoccus sp. MSG2 TaxID=2996790 RepID=UPI00227136C6|nr:hypothetical protein [Pyxidicoccus sp. MSG2]MCY1019685.1 hypothetical protein [Pyxidicoccus sp. MSG2]
MSGISKLSAGPSLASFRSIGSTPEAGKIPGMETAQTALKALSQNPILRSLLGESAFEGVSGKGKAEKAGAAEKANPQEALQKILETLEQLVNALKTLAGEKGGEAEQAGGPEGAQQAGGAQQPGGAQQAGGAQQPGGAEGAQQAGGAEGAGGIAEDEDEKDPIKKLLKTLQQMVQMIGQLLQSMGSQGAAPVGGATGGAAPAAAA